MMSKEAYRDLNGVRKLYLKRKQTKLQKQRKLGEKREEGKQQVNDLKIDLKFKKADMLRDKKLREEHGFTNDKDWKVEIEKLTQPDLDTITKCENDYQSACKELEKSIEDLTVEITGLEWELRIKLEYYKDQSLQVEQVYVEQVGSEEIEG
jgi:hypothetical protein